METYVTSWKSLCVMFFLAILFSSHQGHAPTIGITPATQEAQPGNVVVVDVVSSDVIALLVFGFDLLHDNNILQPLNLAVGPFLSNGGLNLTVTDVALPFMRNPNITDETITGIGNAVILGTGVHGSNVLASVTLWG